MARAGGKAAAESRQLAQLLGLWTPPDGHAFAPYDLQVLRWEALDTTLGRFEHGWVPRKEDGAPPAARSP